MASTDDQTRVYNQRVKTEIESRFFSNLERVQHLVEVYQGASTGAGRRSVDTSDVLRAAVVFLHATLEDLLRSLLEWKLPSAAAAHLKEVPIGRQKTTLDLHT